MKKIAFLLIALTVSIFFTSCTQPNSPTPQKKEFTITFNDGSGNTYTQVFVEGTPQNLKPFNFTMPNGKGFSGWTTRQSSTSIEYKNVASFSATENDTFYPVWVDNVKYVTATLNDAKTEITIKEDKDATEVTGKQLKAALNAPLDAALNTIPFHNKTSITKITIVPPENGARITPETDITELFYHFQALETLENFDLLDTSSVTNMKAIFASCTNLKNIEFLKGWVTSNVEVMSYMFHSCSALTEVTALKDWDTSSVTNMVGMFFDCSALISLDFSGSGWNAPQIPDASGVDNMFGYNEIYSLTKEGVKVGPNINNFVLAEINALPETLPLP